MSKPKMREPLVKRKGMSTEALERMAKENAKALWWTRCPSCGQKIEGTIAELSTSCPHCGVDLSGKSS